MAILLSKIQTVLLYLLKKFFSVTAPMVKKLKISFHDDLQNETC